ncbi:hemolysin [Hahella sp. CCB-MM4]|uniref:GNAT family N-acetyltransferase n=1 Tax=Hahella sp. (strain CCB-MM4) TaxID=1926491 RepID=UPI000B9B1560|nr:GNAT family N-acyltransferase [Hahella sp. CCB-MM4]OZG70658.1 hemolysin [Hahella sp. CCB-MM4]
MHRSGPSVRVHNICPKAAKLHVRVAESEADVLAAQRLRYQVFTEEFGANLHGAQDGIDQDRFDPHCDHLLVEDLISGQILATTRLLSQDQMPKAGSFYSEGEFDLSNIHRLPGKKLEIGRTCVHADFRNGATLALLWSGIAKYVIDHDFEHLIGCGSISLTDGTQEAWSITDQLKRRFLLEESKQVTPKLALPRSDSETTEPVAIPPLIKAYMRLGAKIGGDPCWDPDFRCADLFILLPISALEARYAKHFLKDQEKSDTTAA